MDRLDWVWRAALGNNELFVGAHATASAYDIADGHLIWTRSVGNDVNNSLDRYLVDSIAVARDGNPVFSFASMGRASESAANSWIIALDGATGTTRWKRQVSASNLATDWEGNVYFQTGGGGSGLYSVDSAGSPRWTNASFHGAFEDLAVWNGLAVGDSVVRTADGTMAGTFEIGSQAASRFALVGPTGFCQNDCRAALDGFLAYVDYSAGLDRDFVAPIQTVPAALGLALAVKDSVTYPTSHPTLMKGARMLVTRTRPDPYYKTGNVLTVYAPSGASTCELQGGEWSGLYPVVQPGRLVTVVGAASSAGAAAAWHGGVVAFDAPGFEPEAHGWITHRGSYARNGRAR